MKLFPLKKILTFVKRKMTDWLSHIFSAFKTIKVRSNVLTYLGWYGILILGPSFYGLLTSGDLIIKVFCGILITGYTLYNVKNYEYWKRVDPDRLHSEKFYIDKMKLEWMIGKQGEPPRLSDPSEPTEPPPPLLPVRRGK